MKVQIDNIGFGHLGNGYSVYDRSRDESGDYMRLAHISVKREVVFYKDIDHEAKDFILNQAATLDPTSKEILISVADAEAYNARIAELRKEHGLATIISKRGNDFEATGIDAQILFELLGFRWSRKKQFRKVGKIQEEVFFVHEFNLRDVLKALVSIVETVVVDHGSYIKVHDSNSKTA